MLEQNQLDDLITLLAWYDEMGVDSVVGEEPVDWLSHGEAAPGAGIRMAFRHAHSGAAGLSAATTHFPDTTDTAIATGTSPEARPPVQTPSPPARNFPTKAPDEAVNSARSKARSATSLQDLHDLLTNFDGCALKATAKNLCFYRGAQTARIMVIGEAPGRDEDFAGKPFVGRAGLLLDKMLAAIGLGENNCHITNIVYWRPPGNRTPTLQEAQICRPFLDRQIELVAPEIIFLLGGAAAKNMLEASEGIMRLRGKWREVEYSAAESGAPTTIKALATLHPAYLLRTPAAKRLAWRDLLMIKAALEE